MINEDIKKDKKAIDLLKKARKGEMSLWDMVSTFPEPKSCPTDKKKKRNNGERRT